MNYKSSEQSRTLLVTLYLSSGGRWLTRLVKQPGSQAYFYTHDYSVKNGLENELPGSFDCSNTMIGGFLFFSDSSSSQNTTLIGESRI